MAEIWRKYGNNASDPWATSDHPIATSNQQQSRSIPEHPKMEMNSSMDERIPTDAGGGFGDI